MTPEQRTKLEPVVESRILFFRMSGIPLQDLRTWAWEILEAAFHTFDPDKAPPGLKTWAGWHLKKLSRRVIKRVTKEEGIERIPEHRAYHITTYCRAREELQESLGRSPTSTEIAHEMHWSVKEVNRMQRELHPANTKRLLERLGA